MKCCFHLKTLLPFLLQSTILFNKPLRSPGSLSRNITHEPTALVALVALVLRFAPPRLAANLPSPQVLGDDGAVRMNCFSLKIPDNLIYQI